MATNNSLLLFGDYGPEIIKLSDLYDPFKAKYRRTNDGEHYSSGTQYYLPIIKPNRMIEFQPIDGSDIDKDANGILNRHYWYDAGASATDQNGKYVPAEKSIVIVDTPDSRWGTYTLLAVDRVDTEGEEPTYESTLVPINFSGGIDIASRAIDYNNNSMMLYIEDVVGGGQRLIPDRKLMMYGPNKVRYAIRKTIDGSSVDICTNSQIGAHANAIERGDYVAASSTYARVSTVDVYKSLAGKIVSYYDANGDKITFRVEVETNADTTLKPSSQTQYEELNNAYLQGREVFVDADSNDTLSHVYVPRPCYLRNSITPLVAGETVEFFVYEMVADDNGGEQEDRLVFASKVIVKEGASSYSADPTEKVIVGFGVRREGETADLSDVWEVSSGAAKSLAYTPYLKFDDGSTADIAQDDNCFFAYGMEQIVNGSPTEGAEYDLLFKYFPNRAHGIKNHDAYDGRYIKVNLVVENGEVLNKPSPMRRYFVKDANNAFILAENDGHPETFDASTVYYTNVEKFTWDAAVARPTRDMLTCRKRVRIKSNADRGVSKITVIPVWDKDTQKWSFNYLVYKKDFTRPKLLIGGVSDDETVTMDPAPGVLPLYENGSFDNTQYDVALIYASHGASAAYDAATKNIKFMIQHWTLSDSAWDRWLFSWNLAGTGTALNSDPISEIPYGKNGTDYQCRRPFINCEIMEVPGSDAVYGKYSIDTSMKDGFPVEGNDNWFLKNFMERYLASTDESIFQRTSGSVTETIVPNKFIVRSATESDVCTAAMPISEFGNQFVCAGLPMPTAIRDEICVVEFIYSTSDHDEYLFGVPVEIRLKTNS